MKVYNLTDVATPALKNRGLVKAPIRIGKTVVQPGTMEVIPDRHHAQTQKYVQMGAMSVNHLPKTYRGATYVSPPPPEEEKADDNKTSETEAPPLPDPPAAVARNEIPPPPDTESSPGGTEEDEPTGGKKRRSRRRTR